MDLIIQARLHDTTLLDTPLELNVKYRKVDDTPLSKPTLYRKLVFNLVYLTITGPDINNIFKLLYYPNLHFIQLDE